MIRRAETGQRQTELADAALLIIATRGITALTTRALAEQVGLTSGAIFKHFASLDALLEAVVARVEAVLDSTFPADDTSSPLERLEHFIEARTTAVGERVGILRLLLSEQFQLALPKQGAERLSRCVQKTRAFVIATLRDAQASGEVRTDISAEALGPIVMGTIQMLALTRSRNGDAAATREALHTLLSNAVPTKPRKVP